MTRQLLGITDLAKRDAPLALRRLESFLKDLNSDENVPGTALPPATQP
jgi:hypothetical protein